MMAAVWQSLVLSGADPNWWQTLVRAPLIYGFIRIRQRGNVAFQQGHGWSFAGYGIRAGMDVAHGQEDDIRKGIECAQSAWLRWFTMWLVRSIPSEIASVTRVLTIESTPLM